MSKDLPEKWTLARTMREKRMEMVAESVSNDRKCTLEGTAQGASEDLKEIYCS